MTERESFEFGIPDEGNEHIPPVLRQKKLDEIPEGWLHAGEYPSYLFDELSEAPGLANLPEVFSSQYDAGGWGACYLIEDTYHESFQVAVYVDPERKQEDDIRFSRSYGEAGLRLVIPKGSV